MVNLIRLPKLIYVSQDDLTCVYSTYPFRSENLTDRIQPDSDVGAAIWSQAEVCLGIVAACLPCLRPLMYLIYKTLLKSGTNYLSWRRSKAGTGSYQMHSVKKKDSKRSSVEQRLSAFANETWTPHPIAQCDDTYQGDKIREAARGGWKGGSTGSDDVDTDLEKVIWKKVSLEIIRDSNGKVR